MNETSRSSSPTVARVVKVGGSLLSWERLQEGLNSWLAAQPPQVSLLLAGGGELVESLRAAHDRFRLSEATSHWLALRAMTVTSRLLAHILNVELVEDFATVKNLVLGGAPRTCVFDCEEFLREHEPNLPGCRLPHTWSCTSDSIAARLASVLETEELVLLKSTAWPAGLDYRGAAERGLVDPHFPEACRQLTSVRWIHLTA